MEGGILGAYVSNAATDEGLLAASRGHHMCSESSTPNDNGM